MNAPLPKPRLYLGYENWDAKTERGDRLGYPGDGHMLTIGPTRSGKSRRLLIPNLLYETGRSMLVVDMKGELATLTAEHRASKGGRVVALDPFGVLAKRGVKVPTVGFNPMLGLDPESDDFVDDAMMIAEALVQVSPTAKDPHWAESAQDVVAAVIMWVKTVRREDAELNAVRHMIGQPAKSLKVIALAAERANAHPAISRKLAKFLEAGKESTELASVLSTAQTQTRFLDSPGIVRNLAQGGLQFEELKTSNLTVFLVLPPQRLVTHAKWLRLIISAAMQAMQKDLDTGEKPPVLFMLDEFPQLGRLQSIETAVSLNAGFGVKVWAAVQHLGQLKEHYGDNWETFLSAGCVTAFAPRDVFTRDHLTKMIGTGSKAMRSVSHGNSGGPSYTDSVMKDDLVSPHQWREMAMGDHWAFIPTQQGPQLIKRLHSPDFTKLPEVVAGQIRV